MLRLTLAAALFAVASAAPAADLVGTIPGFDKAPFDTYSGYLTVPGPFKLNSYSSLKIAYILNTAQDDAAGAKPLVTWHQGGPGGNSFYGLFGEEGYFQVSEEGTRVNNATSWNLVANMLYLDSPAGSNDPVGFSTCSTGGTVETVCKWDDKSQAEAYAHTMMAFYKAFPEFSTRPLYMTGESYAGQYVPNIANFILSNPTFKAAIPLTGLALGNACWGGDANNVQCNGPNAEQNDLDNYWGKGLISNALYKSTNAACAFNRSTDLVTSKAAETATGAGGLKCDALLEEVNMVVGPHDVYDIYDNCPGAAEWFEQAGKSPRWLKTFLRTKMNEQGQLHHAAVAQELSEVSGGYRWPCGGIGSLGDWLKRADVRTALHFGAVNPVRFDYSTSGPASIVLWPSLVKQLRVLIYNGDADDCVPYHGNEEWTTNLADQGVLKEKKAWHPWYKTAGKGIPAGYATTYDVTGSDKDFSFITIRLAGHMVPAFRNDAAYAFITRFLAAKAF